MMFTPKIIIIFGIVCFSLLFSIDDSFAQTSNLIKLLPTDDAHVYYDKPNDEGFHFLQRINTGNSEYLQTNYLWNTQQTELSNTSAIFIQFDLTNIEKNNISKAQLVMYPISIDFDSNDSMIILYDVPNSSWNESKLYFGNMPFFNPSILSAHVITEHDQVVILDLTQSVREKAGTNFSTVIFLDDNTKQNFADVVFHSKESRFAELAPTLEIEYSDKIIIPTDDAFVTANLVDSSPDTNFRDKKFGTSSELITMYSWNTTKFNELIVSPIYQKFDLTELNGKVSKAFLNMFVIGTSLENQKTTFNIYPVDDNSWNESELTYYLKPEHEETPISQSVIEKGIFLASWDITNYVNENIKSEMSLAINFDVIPQNQIEQISFYSKETPDIDKSPFISVTYSIPELLLTSYDNFNELSISKDQIEILDYVKSGHEFLSETKPLAELIDELKQQGFGYDSIIVTTSTVDSLFGTSLQSDSIEIKVLEQKIKELEAETLEKEKSLEEKFLVMEKELEELKKSSDNGGGCLIATAAYGSELTPQVQSLRELRDNAILSTQSGTAFLKSFNTIYYSFSPYIADLERQNPLFKEAVKLTITPLLTSLSLFNYVEIDSEAEMLGYGISIILLNLGMYFAAPIMLIYKINRKKNTI